MQRIDLGQYLKADLHQQFFSQFSNLKIFVREKHLLGSGLRGTIMLFAVAKQTPQVYRNFSLLNILQRSNFLENDTIVSFARSFKDFADMEAKYELYTTDSDDEVLSYEKLSAIYKAFNKYDQDGFGDITYRDIKRDLTRAIEQLKEIRKKYKNNAIVCFFSMITHFYAHDFEEARKFAQDCLAFDTEQHLKEALYDIAEEIRQMSQQLFAYEEGQMHRSNKANKYLVIDGKSNKDEAQYSEVIAEILTSAAFNWIKLQEEPIRNITTASIEYQNFLKARKEEGVDTVMVFGHGDVDKHEQNRVKLLFLNESKERDVLFKDLRGIPLIESSTNLLLFNCYTPTEEAILFRSNVIACHAAVNSMSQFFLLYAYFVNRFSGEDEVYGFYFAQILTRLFTSQAEHYYLKIARDAA